MINKAKLIRSVLEDALIKINKDPANLPKDKRPIEKENIKKGRGLFERGKEAIGE